MPYAILFIYFSNPLQCEIKLMPHTMRTYFDPNNHNARKKGQQNEINFL